MIFKVFVNDCAKIRKKDFGFAIRILFQTKSLFCGKKDEKINFFRIYVGIKEKVVLLQPQKSTIVLTI
jgi:hypothetical protein